MDTKFLQKFRRKYGDDARSEPDALARITLRHAAMQKTRLLDLAAVATSLAYVDRDALDELALRAIRDTNPAFDPSRIEEYSSEQWMGITNAAKGKYFEYMVVDRLNSGEAVGDLYLPRGYSAQLAESMTQPGWDMRIVDENGGVVELLQMKATESVGYVQDALERYPDIRILATDEAADHLGDNVMVIDANMSEQDLAEAVDQTLHDLAPGSLDQFWESFNPLLPTLIIAASQGYSVAIGKQRVSDALVIAGERAARGLIASSVGAVVKVATDSVLLAAPASILAGFWFDRLRNTDAMARLVRAQQSRQRQRSTYLVKLAERGV